MVTPQEIEVKEFSRSVRGYDRDEVDEFLDLIILDLQELLSSMEVLRKENEELKVEIEEHKKSQKKVMDTLESAKKLMKDISDSAEKRADIIIQNAKMDAEQIINNARESVPQPVGLNTGSELHDKIVLFKTKYRQLLKDELENLDSKSDDLLSELEKEFIPTSIDTQIMNFSDIIDDEELNSNTVVLDSVNDSTSDEKDSSANEFEVKEISLTDADELLAQLESEAEEIAKNTGGETNLKYSPLSKDTIMLDAEALDELIAKKSTELESE